MSRDGHDTTKIWKYMIFCEKPLLEWDSLWNLSLGGIFCESSFRRVLIWLILLEGFFVKALFGGCSYDWSHWRVFLWKPFLEDTPVIALIEAFTHYSSQWRVHLWKPKQLACIRALTVTEIVASLCRLMETSVHYTSQLCLRILLQYCGNPTCTLLHNQQVAVDLQRQLFIFQSVSFYFTSRRRDSS